jgi:hypothetical protein
MLRLIQLDTMSTPNKRHANVCVSEGLWFSGYPLSFA